MGRLSIMFPHALLFLLAAFSVALVVKGLVRPERRSIFAEGDRAKIIGTCAILFVWVVAIPYIGFFLASVAGFWGIACYLATRITSYNVCYTKLLRESACRLGKAPRRV